MDHDSTPYVPFSQRTGIAPVPPQLKLGEVSGELRRLLSYYISLEIDRETYGTYTESLFKEEWNRVAKDLHVLFFRQPADKFDHGSYKCLNRLNEVIARADIGVLFDLIEFLVRHPKCSDELKRELSSAFVMSRAAYRIIDSRFIAAIGTEEQAEAVERAFENTDGMRAPAARRHLVASGVALRNADWAGSVRESIHAVEAAAKLLASEADTLGDALKVLEKRGQVHGRLKAAFDKLYAYSNADNVGARHALVFDESAAVDEVDALFMLGACASFVSYLLARSYPASRLHP